ncbi:FAD binding domain-containing protein [Nocardioides sp. LMS-CY]|uniref:Carbon-monoxide dehydrogenase medium subunit n=1 Tax=Nocardioides soli TaxID=1036020 RepID=A0A7W4Z161_9ACTN|nr:FAD binding domain-containing protein [Nocardioides sp. LMS-CY]MBB3042602.1 carbon-monoxide dehydrogenase medium subunit [Nocardioides soli]QWF22726.1 FAD binding domain-containing protein [Nocardioides sp. LMS-CY]
MIPLLPTFRLSRPATLPEAFDLLADDGIAYVGGTELVAAMQLGLVSPAHLVDLKRIPALGGIRLEGEVLVIGSAVRHVEVADSELVRRSAPILARACAELGNARVRATGTVGGNLCFADPRSDVATALFALGARVRLRSADGERVLPIDEFVLGAMDVDLDEGELLDSVLVPVTVAPQVYLRHQPTEYPTIAVALVSDPEGLRVTVGAVGEIPQRFAAPSLDELDVEAILPELEVIEDLNGSESYKRHLVGVFVRRAAAELKESNDA